MTKLQRLRADCAYIKLHLLWMESGPPDVVRFENEPKKLDAAISNVTEYCLKRLNCPLRKGVGV